MFVGALFAFWKPYLSRLPNGDVFAHLHAVLAVAWCVGLALVGYVSARAIYDRDSVR